MPNIPRHLILSTDEKTWKIDQPTIFLDEWCCNYNQIKTFKGMDAIFASPYGLKLHQKDNDYIKVRLLEKKLFLILCDCLNKYHGIHHEERFWKIVCGHWLRRYVDRIFYLTKKIEKCINKYKISGVTTYAIENYNLATKDSLSAFISYQDPKWINVVGSQIIKLLGNNHFKIEIIEDLELNKPELNLTNTPLKIFLKYVASLFTHIAKDSDAFIINSYLPKREEIKLQLALDQFPQFWISPNIKIYDKFNSVLRQDLSRKFIKKSPSNFEYIASKLLFECLPISYLEGFNHLNNVVKNLHWPKNPKFIFTSNNFEYDEVFKLWTAHKVNLGINYIIGQHGNNYGTHRYINNTIDEITADKFLTWGWSDNLKNHKPSFVFRTAAASKYSKSCATKLLLIEEGRKFCESNLYVNCEYSLYLNDQNIFIKNLTYAPKNKLFLRLPKSASPNWNNEFKNIILENKILENQIERTNKPFKNLLKKSRLVVFSYDSTGMLETLSLNIPTIAFWHGGLNHLRDSAKPYYQLLVNVGILHFSAQSAAEKINGIWNNIDNWWFESKLQEARRQFCKKYAKFSETPIYDLKKILLE